MVLYLGHKKKPLPNTINDTSVCFLEYSPECNCFIAFVFIKNNISPKNCKIGKIGKNWQYRKSCEKAKKTGESYLVSDSGMTEIYINPMTVKPKENP